MISSLEKDLLQIAKKPLLFIVLVVLWATPIFAQRSLELSYSAPKQVKLYHSYQAKLLTLSLQEKPTASNGCGNNRYIFYDYGRDKLFEVRGGNLLISRDSKKAILSSTLSLKAVNKAGLQGFSRKLSKIAHDLKASSDLLEKTRITSKDQTKACWQQLVLLDLQTQTQKKYPMILANLCKTGNCTQFKMTKNSIANLWVSLKPDQFTQVNLNLKSGIYNFGGSKKPFFIKPVVPENAYLENLLKQTKGKLKLSQSKRNQSYVEWTTVKGQRVIKLVRTGVDVRGAQELSKKIAEQNKLGNYQEAISLAAFVLWLDPDSVEAEYEKLKATGLMGDLDGFFKKLRHGMNYKKRIDTCRKLHLDQGLQPLWRQSAFINQFKEACP